MTMKIFVLVLMVNLAWAFRDTRRWNNEAARQYGPNVCAVEVNDEINYAYYTENRYWNPRNICGKQTVIRYECCSGYYRVTGYAGCIGVKPLVNLIEATRRTGATKFAKLLERSNIIEKLRRHSAITIFAPTNEAFEDYLRIKGIGSEWLFDNHRHRNLISNHVIDRRLLSNQWEANFLIQSGLGGHSLRINKFSNQIETVNCHRIIRKDQVAINGVVHLIDGVLDPALTHDTDIIDLATRDGRFSIFMKALEASKLGNRIKFGDIPYTIFAPTDEAFHSISQIELQEVLSNPDTLNALIAHHIVDHPVCIPNIISEYKTRTMQRQKLSLNCGSHGPTVEHVNLGHEMLHGKNGLLYALNSVLLPDRAKTVLELIREEGLFAFLEIIKSAGLEETLAQLKHFTVFVPTEEALQSLSSRQFTEIRRNHQSAREFVLNHIVKGQYFTDGIYSNQVATTLEFNIPLRFQVYRDSFGIENALILKADKVGSNGILHIISHVLHPARQSLDNILREDGNFSIWLNAMERIKETQPQVYQEFKRGNSSCTYFIPSDEAFKKLGNIKLQSLLDDNNYLTKTLKNHIVDNILLSESFKPNLQYTVKTKQDMVNIRRKNDTMLVNTAMLVKPDILNKDGIAHEINEVLLPNQCSRGFNKYHGGLSRKSCI